MYIWIDSFAMVYFKTNGLLHFSQHYTKVYCKQVFTQVESRYVFSSSKTNQQSFLPLHSIKPTNFILNLKNSFKNVSMSWKNTTLIMQTAYGKIWEIVLSFCLFFYF